MEQRFEIGDFVRKKPRGQKMVVNFVYTPYCEGVYLAAYQCFKMRHPSADYFYTCISMRTGKTIDGIFPEDVLEKVIHKK